MGVGDIIHDGAYSIINEFIEWYDKDPYEILENVLILDVVAACLKAVNITGYVRPTAADLKRIDEFDWVECARKAIIEQIEEKEDL